MAIQIAPEAPPHAVPSTLPRLIQGGMGIAVSGWQLARAVAQCGQLGVISGTGIEFVVARRLQDGDIGGHIRRALAAFPDAALAARILAAWFRPDGHDPDRPYIALPMYQMHPRRELLELIIAANFTEVWLAKEEHDGLVGINLLEKVQMPHLAALYGAMLAGVDYVIMGAGIPIQIPGVLDRLAEHEPVRYQIDVVGATADDDYGVVLTPRDLVAGDLPSLKRPQFLAIVSSVVLAKMLLTKASGVVNGFVIEGPLAGGHNAPPRGKMQLSERGEPIYGERDTVDLAKMRELGTPFWLAGAYARPDKIQDALAAGAAGIQAGTIFALADESGLLPEYRARLRETALAGTLAIFTDPAASPTDYPFKVAQLPATLAEADRYAERPRVCDIGRLRSPYKRPDGAIGFRCPSEPVALYVAKGGRIEDTVGRKCLCNALMANIGLPQVQKHGYREQPLITLGDDYGFIHDLMPDGTTGYSARDAIAYLGCLVESNVVV